MQTVVTVTPAQLPEILLNVAVVRPVFLWGPPGVGKSALVRDFAASLGLECVTMLGTQLAPEDIIGVPEVVDGRSRFAPPESIARSEPYCLFLDELNASVPEVQKAFYSLILDRRIGGYELPAGSVVIGAGNRTTDNALARPMGSALVNRLVHLHLRVSPDDWLAWAGGAGIHHWVTGYVRQRPDHLWSAPRKTEEPFSTPRTWHMLSDVLQSHGEDIDADTLAVLAFGLLSGEHAASFRAYVMTARLAYDLDTILAGDAAWPRRTEERDVLYFLADAFRARLAKALPADRSYATTRQVDLAHRSKALLVELAEISAECAQLVVAADENGAPVLPAWFVVEIGRDVPGLAAARA
jgi:AAA domain (dynein-related subfamily)